MDRADAATVGTQVSKAIEDARVSAAEIAEAIGLTSDEMRECLDGAVAFSASQLVMIGGLLHAPAGDLLGVTA